MPIRKPDFLAGVVNSRLRSSPHPLIFCERPTEPPRAPSRVTVTYLTEGTHYLTQGQGLHYLAGKPISPPRMPATFLLPKD